MFIFMIQTELNRIWVFDTHYIKILLLYITDALYWYVTKTEFIFFIMVEKCVFFIKIQMELDYSIRKTLIILYVGTL